MAVACLAVRARGVRDNNREAAFIGLAVGLSLPIWVSSGIGSLAAGSEDDREAWLAYGLLATSLFVFLTMFLPKGRQLAALGREGPAAVIHDRDDALSSLPGSGYSPSFFHFKPAEASLKRKMHYHSAGKRKEKLFVKNRSNRKSSITDIILTTFFFSLLPNPSFSYCARTVRLYFSKLSAIVVPIRLFDTAKKIFKLS